MNYFLWINGTQAGPYPWTQIKALLAEKSVTLETLFWKEGMADWQPLSTLYDQANAAGGKPRVFSGFWRRLGALVIDWIILCLAGNILGTAFFDFFSHLGSLGPLVGLGMALLYFGLQNSVLCGGQTPGKRLLRIEVVDAEGKSISPEHSLVRYLILGLPFFLLDPVVQSPLHATWTGLLLAQLLGAVLAFWIGTIIYLFLFNLPSRQSLHDRIVNTYVVRTVTKGEVTTAPFWIWHYILLCLIGLGLLGSTGAATLLITQWGPFASQLVIQRAVQANPRVEYVSTSVGKNWTFTKGGPEKMSSLEIGAFWNRKPNNMGEAARSVAKVVLAKAPDEVARQDVLKIQISYGYDIGIASSSVSANFAHSPREWKQIVANASPP